MFLLLLPFFLGQDEGPTQAYLRYQSGPLEPLPYDAQRYGPWAPDHESRGKFLITTDTTSIATPHPADYGSAGFMLAQAGSDAGEAIMLDNLERLEREMQEKLTQPPVPVAPEPAVQVATEGMKAVPGWLVEVHDWNEGGRLGEDPVERVLTRSCPFRGDFRARASNSLYIYHFSAIFRVTEPGRYVFGFDLTCNVTHSCSVAFAVDGQQIIDFQGLTEGQIIRQGVPLTVGDHKLEFKTHLNRKSYMTYDPGNRYRWEPLVQGPNDFNLGPYRTDHLFAVVPQHVNEPVQACR